MDSRGGQGRHGEGHSAPNASSTERKRLEQLKQQDQEKLQTEIRRKWATKSAHFTTPGLRPLAEPPLLNWKKFKRVHIFSDLRYEKLFPDDVKKKGKEKRARMKDLRGEWGALFEYMAWLKRAVENNGGIGELEDEMLVVDEKRREFFRRLREDLLEDYYAVEKEMQDLHDTASQRGKFEYRYLTNDGELTRIKDWLGKGADIFEGYGEEVVKKYGYLKPEGWEASADTTLEAQLADDDGGKSKVEFDLETMTERSSLVTVRLPYKHRNLRYKGLDKDSMWITPLPGMRPLAEPPVVDCWSFREYETQMHIEPVREDDDSYKILLPWEPARLRQLQDLRMEEAALGEYHTWVGMMEMSYLESDGKLQKARKNFYLDLGNEVFEDILGEKGVANEELAFWDRQEVLVEEKRLEDIEDEKKAKEGAELKARLKAEAAELKRLEEEEDREMAEEEARRYAASWKGVVDINVRNAFSLADRVVRARY